jgi:hypothetical protein
VKNFFGYPAGIVGLLTAAVTFVVSLNLKGFDAGQASLWVAATAAVGQVVMAWRVRPVAPAIITAAMSALVALGSGYGMHLRPDVTGGLTGLVLALAALLTHAQVTPAGGGIDRRA